MKLPAYIVYQNATPPDLLADLLSFCQVQKVSEEDTLPLWMYGEGADHQFKSAGVLQ